MFAATLPLSPSILPLVVEAGANRGHQSLKTGYLCCYCITKLRGRGRRVRGEEVPLERIVGLQNGHFPPTTCFSMGRIFPCAAISAYTTSLACSAHSSRKKCKQMATSGSLTTLTSLPLMTLKDAGTYGWMLARPSNKRIFPWPRRKSMSVGRSNLHCSGTMVCETRFVGIGDGRQHRDALRCMVL